MLSIDGTFLVILLSFVIFMGLMKSLYFAPLMRIKHERESTIQGSHQIREEANGKAAQLSQQYSEELAKARSQAQQLIQEQRDRAKGSATEHLSLARQKAFSEMEQQASRIQKSREKVYQSLEPQREAFIQVILDRISPLQEQKSATGSSSPSAVR